MERGHICLVSLYVQLPCGGISTPAKVDGRGETRGQRKVQEGGRTTKRARHRYGGPIHMNAQLSHAYIRMHHRNAYTHWHMSADGELDSGWEWSMFGATLRIGIQPISRGPLWMGMDLRHCQPSTMPLRGFCPSSCSLIMTLVT